MKKFSIAMVSFCLMIFIFANISYAVDIDITGFNAVGTGTETFRMDNVFVPGLDKVVWVNFKWSGMSFVVDDWGEIENDTVCGAYVAPGVWKEFDCYNLAAIGKTTNDDPFTPSWRLIGGYWQWGRKGPSSSQWYDTNTSNFAHGPTDSGSSEANDDSISGWDNSYASDDSWSDSYKTSNDPCPSGYRVPTDAQWQGVDDNNSQSAVGSWDNSATNYSSGRFFGDDLMLSAAGFRSDSSGSVLYRGSGGYYWSSLQYASTNAWYLLSYSSSASTVARSRRDGFSVRCVAE